MEGGKSEALSEKDSLNQAGSEHWRPPQTPEN